MRDNNDFDESKLEATEIKLTSENPVLSWLDNFWYYHKWKVIIILFFAIIFAVGIVQMVKKEEAGETVIVAAPITFYVEYIEGLDNTLVQFLPDGTKNLVLQTYPIYSESEMNAANEAETDEDGRYIEAVNQSYNTSKHGEYSDYLKTGECSVLIISRYLYENLLSNDRLRPLEDIFGSKKVEGALPDGHGVCLGDTYLYEYFEEIQVLPEDTVICILRPYIWGASSHEDKYAKSVELFKNLVSFGN